MYYSWEQYRNLPQNQDLPFQNQWMKYNDIVNESSVSSVSISPTAGAGGKGQIKSKFFTIQVNIQNIGDTIDIYVTTSDYSQYTISWGDGITDIVNSSDNINHIFNLPGIYNIILLSPTILITGFLIQVSAPGIYTVLKKHSYSVLTQLNFLGVFADISEIEDGALDNSPITQLVFKYENLPNLKNFMFNNIKTLEYIGFGLGTTITSFDYGIFSGLTNLSQIDFYATQFSTSTLVDSFLIDLNDSMLSNCTLNIDSTSRTTASDSAVSDLTGRDCTINTL